MNEIPRLQHNQYINVTTPTQVAPARPIADRTQTISEHERRKQSERRKRNRKPLIERRTSSDRRGPRFEAKV